MSEMETGYCGKLESEDIIDGKGRFVIREVKMQNFIHFETKQTLTFDEDGAFYFIGQNHTGKSSVFEAIRRCLCLSSSKSVSSACKDEDSVVICRYQNTLGDELFSFNIRLKASQGESYKHIHVKGCFLKMSDGISNYGLDFVKTNQDNMLVSENIANVPTYNFKEYKERCYLDSILKWVLNIPDITSKYSEFCKTDMQPVKVEDTKCEHILKNHLSNVICSFPLRGIGPLQWSKSLKKDAKCRQSNYIEASQRAEILMWYLENVRDKRISYDEIERESKYYKMLTNDDECLYELGDDPLNKEIIVKRKGESFPLLKQSEGFIEAKYCSILLAMDEFSTIILEEPGTGMHVQMIERLRDLLFTTVKDKVVLISTHNPRFITHWTMPRLFYFQRHENDKCSIKSGKEIMTSWKANIQTKKSPKKKAKTTKAITDIISAEQLGTIFFANKLIFVEGKSDHLFIEALKMFLMNPDESYCPGLSSIQCLEMSGALNTDNFKRCCTELGKECLFILDGDVKKKTNVSENILHIGYNNLEHLFTELLEELISKRINIKTIEDSLKNCFGENRLTIDNDNVLTKYNPPKGAKVKLFLHGGDDIHDRINLIKFLSNTSKPGSALAESEAGNCLKMVIEQVKTFANRQKQRPSSCKKLW